MNFPSQSESRRERLLWIKIGAFVIALHTAFLSFSTLWKLPPPPPKSRTAVRVQTVSLRPDQPKAVAEVTLTMTEQTPLAPVPLPETTTPEQTALQTPPHPPPRPAEPVPSQPNPPSPPPKTEPLPKKGVKKTAAPPPPPPPAKKTPAPPNKPLNRSGPNPTEGSKRESERAELEKKKRREAEAAREAALLAKAKESLAKIGEKRNKDSSPASLNLDAATLPTLLGSLQIDALPTQESGASSEWTTQELGYADQVAHRLKTLLLLPEYGAVRIRLTLTRAGKVSKFEVTGSESVKNKSYAESKIPTLPFPPFDKHFPGMAEKIFDITLQNAS